MIDETKAVAKLAKAKAKTNSDDCSDVTEAVAKTDSDDEVSRTAIGPVQIISPGR